MSARIIAQLAVFAGTTVFFAAQSQATVVMDQPFNTTLPAQGGVFDKDAVTDPIGTVDDSANGGGIWKSTKSSTATYSGWGNPGGGLNIQAGGVINGDIGTAISSGTVTVTMDLKRETRGGIIGGRATEELTNLAGDATDMLFGVIWEHNFVYNIDPGGYYGNEFVAVPNSNNNWNTISFTLDFATDTYSVSIGETGTVWSNLPMNTSVGNDFLQYVYIESIVGQGSSVYYDNVVVDHVEIPEPASMGVVAVLGVAALGRRFRSGR